MKPARSANSTETSRSPAAVSCVYRPAQRSSRHDRCAATAMITNAASISTCHSHHDRCQLRPSTTAISASASRVNAAANASGNGEAAWRGIRR